MMKHTTDKEEEPLHLVHAVREYLTMTDMTDLQMFKVKVHSRRMLEGLEEIFKKRLENYAVWVMEMLLLPLCVLLQAKRRRQRLTKIRWVDYNRDQIRRVLVLSDIFQPWPSRVLEEILDSTTETSYSKGETIFYENEPTRAIGIFISGSLTVTLRPAGSTKKEDCQCLTIFAPKVIGDYAIISEEPRVHVRASSECFMVFLESHTFLRMLKQLPQAVQTIVAGVSLLKRKMNMANRILTREDLEKSAIVASVPSELGEEVVKYFEADVVPRGTCLCVQGETVENIYYIMNGEVKVLLSQNGVDHEVARLGAGEVVGEFSVWYAQQQTASVITTSVCEVWVLAKRSVDLLRSILNSDVMDRRTKGHRESHLLRIKQFAITEIASKQAPIFSDVLSHEQFTEMLAMIKPEIFLRGDIIVSRSDQADKLIYLGTNQAYDHQNHRCAKQGTFLGHTCMLRHKWATTLIATSYVHAWTVARESIFRYLHGIGMLNTVVSVTRVLLQPFILKQHLPADIKDLEKQYRSLGIESCVSYQQSDAQEVMFPRYVPKVKKKEQSVKKTNDPNCFKFSTNSSAVIPPPVGRVKQSITGGSTASSSGSLSCSRLDKNWLQMKFRSDFGRSVSIKTFFNELRGSIFGCDDADTNIPSPRNDLLNVERSDPLVRFCRVLVPELPSTQLSVDEEEEKEKEKKGRELSAVESGFVAVMKSIFAAKGKKGVEGKSGLTNLRKPKPPPNSISREQRLHRRHSRQFFSLNDRLRGPLSDVGSLKRRAILPPDPVRRHSFLERKSVHHRHHFYPCALADCYDSEGIEPDASSSDSSSFASSCTSYSMEPARRKALILTHCF